MRSSIALVVFLIPIGFLAGTQAAAQPDRGAPPTIGLGVGLNAASVAPSIDDGPSPLAFTVPITFSDVRIEPHLGFALRQASSGDGTATRSALTFGTGAFYLTPVGDALFEAGARLGVVRTAIARTAARRAVYIDLFLGPALAGEYYLSDHASLGVEARLLYLNVDPGERAPPSQSASLLRTSGIAFLRLHF